MTARIVVLRGVSIIHSKDFQLSFSLCLQMETLCQKIIGSSLQTTYVKKEEKKFHQTIELEQNDDYQSCELFVSCISSMIFLRHERNVSKCFESIFWLLSTFHWMNEIMRSNGIETCTNVRMLGVDQVIYSPSKSPSKVCPYKESDLKRER